MVKGNCLPTTDHSLIPSRKPYKSLRCHTSRPRNQLTELLTTPLIPIIQHLRQFAHRSTCTLVWFGYSYLHMRKTSPNLIFTWTVLNSTQFSEYNHSVLLIICKMHFTGFVLVLHSRTVKFNLMNHFFGII